MSYQVLFKLIGLFGFSPSLYHSFFLPSPHPLPPLFIFLSPPLLLSMIQGLMYLSLTHSKLLCKLQWQAWDSLWAFGQESFGGFLNSIDNCHCSLFPTSNKWPSQASEDTTYFGYWTQIFKLVPELQFNSCWLVFIRSECAIQGAEVETVICVARLWTLWTIEPTWW